MIALIQQTRSLSSLPLSVGDELTLAVSTWLDALAEVPDHLLVPAWRRATKDHDWSKAFPVMAILPAYKALILEDRAAREKAAFSSSRRADDTYACRYCDDTGYMPVKLYCGSFGDWRSARRACNCAATPITQRMPIPDTTDWARDDHGDWLPAHAGASLQCWCLYCKNGRRR